MGEWSFGAALLGLCAVAASCGLVFLFVRLLTFRPSRRATFGERILLTALALGAAACMGVVVGAALHSGVFDIPRKHGPDIIIARADDPSAYWAWVIGTSTLGLFFMAIGVTINLPPRQPE